MKRIMLLLICLLCTNIYGQSLSIFNIDKSKFPMMKANFYAFDANGNQIQNLSLSDFILKENDIERSITDMTCPNQIPVAISSVLVFDISGSMSEGPPRIELAKLAANTWINTLPLVQSECAMVEFDDISSLLHDFTKDKTALINCIAQLQPSGGTDYNQAFLGLPCGGLNIAMTGKNKRVIIFLTDGLSNGGQNTQEIINFAQQNQITIYAATLDMQAPQSIKTITKETGGQCFENITSQKETEEAFQNLLQLSINVKPCEITWMSRVNCVADSVNVDIKINTHNLATKFSYDTPANYVAKIIFSPQSIRFKNPPVGIKIEKKVTIKAINSDFDITDVVSTNKAFEITPTKFALNAGQTQEFTVSYVPADSGYASADFDFINKRCSAMYYAIGGWKGKKPAIRTIKLIHPNGNEEFVVGSDTVITWEGVPPDEPIKIDYTTDNGKTWTTIIDSATDFSYKWRVPNTPSNQCLARITANANDGELEEYPEAIICGETWMAINLSVTKYRNGDTIRYAETVDDWEDANEKGEGAWCYPDNNPANGDIYGKLYNWFAVADPRNLAPKGWHIATREEWDLYCLGPNDGGQLKTIGTIENGDGLWGDPNLGATDEFFFSALPAGTRYGTGGFDSPGTSTRFWTSTESNSGNAFNCYLAKSMSEIQRIDNSKTYGLSVRCVKDIK